MERLELEGNAAADVVRITFELRLVRSVFNELIEDIDGPLSIDDPNQLCANVEDFHFIAAGRGNERADEPAIVIFLIPDIDGAPDWAQEMGFEPGVHTVGLVIEVDAFGVVFAVGVTDRDVAFSPVPPELAADGDTVAFGVAFVEAGRGETDGEVVPAVCVVDGHIEVGADMQRAAEADVVTV